jgi:hypothetical protein
MSDDDLEFFFSTTPIVRQVLDGATIFQNFFKGTQHLSDILGSRMSDLRARLRAGVPSLPASHMPPAYGLAAANKKRGPLLSPLQKAPSQVSDR